MLAVCLVATIRYSNVTCCRGIRGSQAGPSDMPRPVAALRQATANRCVELPTMPPSQRQAWATWIHQQAEAAQAVAAQAAADATSAAAALAGSAQQQPPSVSTSSKTLRRLTSDLQRYTARLCLWQRHVPRTYNALSVW